jgi:hypothetical protein
MRERNRSNLDCLLKDAERPFMPSSEGPSLIVTVLAWVAVAFVVYKGWTFYEARQAVRAAAAVRAATQAAHEQPVRMAPEPRASQPIDQAPPVTQITRAEDPTPARTGGTIYLCRDYGGGTFWASDHCNRHNALIERMVSVPEGMPFQQQVALAEQRRRVLAPAEPVQVTTTSAAPSPGSSKQLCESLSDRVNQLDAMARQPQSASTQDWIRSEREKTRTEQYRLRC